MKYIIIKIKYYLYKRIIIFNIIINILNKV